MKLTQKVVDGIGLAEDRVLWDDEAPGLGCRVQSGKRTWIVRYRVGGVSRQKSMPGTLPLRQARVRAAEIRTGASGGMDIVAAGRAAAVAARRQADTARARSLAPLVDRYLADAAKRLRPGSLRMAKLYLRTHWRALHDRPADELGQREIVSVLEPYAGRATSAQMLRHLSACLSWGMERGLLERNAALGVKAPVQLVARERVLGDGEVRAVWAATEAAAPAGGDGAWRDFCSIVRLLLLLGQRRGEVGGMTRSEIDLQRGLWRLAGERTKNGKPHDVPLPRQAVSILQGHDAEGRTHLFGRRDRGFVAWDRCKAKLDTALRLTRWTLHDLRRTCVTGMSEAGIAPHVVEAVVNHVSGHKGGVAGIYNRAKHAPEKKAALQRWADHVEQVVAGDRVSNVVGFGR
jgi:integrase